MSNDPASIVYEFIRSQIVFIVTAVGVTVTGIKYLTKKHDEKYDNEIRRLDTKIDNLKELLCEAIKHLAEMVRFKGFKNE